MARPNPVERALEWLIRRHALRAAKAERAALGETQRAALAQARLLLEVARRVAEPAEALPHGSRPSVLLDLYRSAITWSLRGGSDGTERPLAELWESAPERVRSAAGAEAAVPALRALLLNQPEAGSLGVPESGVRLVREFAEALERELEAPERNVERLEVQRWTRISVIALLLTGTVVGVPYLLRGPDLAENRPFKLSSVYGGCDERGKCGDLMFHTQIEDNPWITLDLGSVKTVRAVEVKNRTDCCADRAVPLVVELGTEPGTERRNFREVARKTGTFTTWRATFKSTMARYVRLRTPKTTALHLESVKVR